MASVVGGVPDMKNMAILYVILVASVTSTMIFTGGFNDTIAAGQFYLSPNSNQTLTVNDTVTSVSTTVSITTTVTTSVLIQTFTVPTTTYQTLSLRQLNSTTSVAVTVLSSIIIAIPSLTTVTRTSTVSSNTTSVNTIVVPHYQSEYLTSDVLIIVDGLIAAAFSVILIFMLVRWKRR